MLTVPHRITCLHTWATVSGSILGDLELVEDGSLLEEVDGWGMGLEGDGEAILVQALSCFFEELRSPSHTLPLPWTVPILPHHDSLHPFKE